jgi:hypothetical protein
MFKFILAAALTVASTATMADGMPVAAAPPAPRLLLHNGSLMQLAVLPGGRIEIQYAQPRPGLWEIGVRPGTVLLRGQWSGGVLNAEARVFAGACGAPVYPVTGGINADGVLVLSGPAPLVDPWTCVVYGYAWTSNSTLTFFPTNGA